MTISPDKWYVHVNQPRMRSNLKHGTNEPVIRYQRGKYGKPVYAHRLSFEGGTVIQSTDGKPLLGCGARLVIECVVEPTVLS
jgi:hypothetical protein